MALAANNIFLFSVDLEDVRLRMKDGLKYKPRVEVLVDKYLQFLQAHKSKATFFTVGDIPAHYPDLIKTIVSEGHEIACHSNLHIPVTNQTKEEFKTDLLKNLECLAKAGASSVIGYRAPIYSITKKTPWAFEVLSELGFKYSSSVLPAKNPLYGWDGFGEAPKKMNAALWEIPVSVRGTGFLNVPFSGGVYFRVLPMMLIKKSFKEHYSKGLSVTSYFHPYDIDTEQESFMHPGINNSGFYNKLMYYNRKNVFSRLDDIMKTFECKIITYKEYAESLDGK
ncbi:MAG TPA: polysaccharide deacetylase family protein [Bacteroidia bacterium]|jgi:polysaccharide deacetylase family protein (PEP-CTERM system associated)